MKRRGAKFLKVLCFFISITLALVACRGNVDETTSKGDPDKIAATTEDGDSTKSHKGIETPSKTPVPRLPSSVVLGSDPISVNSQKYALPAKYNEVPFFADLVAAVNYRPSPNGSP